MNKLSKIDLKNLINSVFSLSPRDKKLTIIVDVPDEKIKESKRWKQRREIAFDWYIKLSEIKEQLKLEQVSLLYYPNVHNNNADLPQKAYMSREDWENLDASKLIKTGISIDFEKHLAVSHIVIALTQFSATAPLKLLSKKLGFRAATMPGFARAMIPALRVDYEEINHRVKKIKKLLDPAMALEIDFFTVEGKKYIVHFDLRFRTAHVSGGRFPEPGTAGNLPSGECYIVPYEGEKNEKSKSNGILPVQFEDEIVLFEIEKNKALNIISKGEKSKQEMIKLKEEPAYGNIAEIGFGILKDFGVKPSGEILLDEK